MSDTHKTELVMPLADLLRDFKDGDEHGWQTEFDWLWSNHPESMDALCTSINERGIERPIEIGPDGRVWDGHHRICAADMLGLKGVPVRFVADREGTERNQPEEDAS